VCGGGVFIAIPKNKLLAKSVPILESTLYLYFFRKDVYSIAPVALTTVELLAFDTLLSENKIFVHNPSTVKLV
jgi:hypothetical protein